MDRFWTLVCLLGISAVHVQCNNYTYEVVERTCSGATLGPAPALHLKADGSVFSQTSNNRQECEVTLVGASRADLGYVSTKHFEAWFSNFQFPDCDFRVEFYSGQSAANGVRVLTMGCNMANPGVFQTTGRYLTLVLKSTKPLRSTNYSFEMDAVAAERKKRCYSGEWQCYNEGWCIDGGLVCDGVRQCLDGSDEATTYGPYCKYDGLYPGEIAAIILGVILFICILVCVVALVCTCMEDRKSSHAGFDTSTNGELAL